MKILSIVSVCAIFALIILVDFSSAMSAEISIPANHLEVQAGDEVFFETEVKWPENTERKDLRLEYSIRDADGEEIAYMKVLKAIETQASFMDQITIPESTKGGTYKIFLTLTDYKDMEQEIAASFKVVGNSLDSYKFYLMIILGVIGLIALFIVIELFILIRKKQSGP